MTTKKNTVCWAVIHFLNGESSRADSSFRNSDWGPEAAEAMCKQVRNFRIPSGKNGRASTLGDFIDRTPKHLIGKVMLEEKVFETWHGGRVVLIGDGNQFFPPYCFVVCARHLVDAQSFFFS